MNAARPAPRAYRLPPFVRGSIGWHALMAAGLVAAPAAWPWWLGGVAANQIAITGAGLWPRSDWLGPNWRRLPADPARAPSIALTFDDGPDPALTPYTLDRLDAAGLRATFFCIGRRVREHPALAREIVRRGHAVENHSDHHRPSFATSGVRGFVREIDAAQQTIADACGRAPRFFRAPAGLRNPMLEPALARLGLRLAAWTRRGFDTLERDPARILRALTRGLAADDILLLHDGHCARDADGRPVLHAVLPALLARIGDAGLHGIRLDEALPDEQRPENLRLDDLRPEALQPEDRRSDGQRSDDPRADDAPPPPHLPRAS
ncbi:MAG: polysaccharide deacetylase family protein [Burkholderiaceae bacterium]